MRFFSSINIEMKIIGYDDDDRKFYSYFNLIKD